MTMPIFISYFLGSMISSPFLGYWSDRRTAREVREIIFEHFTDFLFARRNIHNLMQTLWQVLAFGLIIGICGNLIYSMSLNIWMLFLGRFLVGVFSGTGSTSSAYLSCRSLRGIVWHSIIGLLVYVYVYVDLPLVFLNVDVHAVFFFNSCFQQLLCFLSFFVH